MQLNFILKKKTCKLNLLLGKVGPQIPSLEQFHKYTTNIFFFFQNFLLFLNHLRIPNFITNARVTATFQTGDSTATNDPTAQICSTRRCFKIRFGLFTLQRKSVQRGILVIKSVNFPSLVAFCVFETLPILQNCPILVDPHS